MCAYCSNSSHAKYRGVEAIMEPWDGTFDMFTPGSVCWYSDDTRSNNRCSSRDTFGYSMY